MIREICKEKRLSLGITQAELARKVGVRKATISDFENGKANMRSSHLEKVLEILGLNIS